MFCRRKHICDPPCCPGAISPVPATDDMTNDVGIRNGQLYTSPGEVTEDDLADTLASAKNYADGKTGPIITEVNQLDDRLETVEDDLANVRQVPEGGTLGKVLTSIGANEYEWQDTQKPAGLREVPEGGDLGQYLKRTTSGYGWSDAPSPTGTIYRHFITFGFATAYFILFQLDSTNGTQLSSTTLITALSGKAPVIAHGHAGSTGYIMAGIRNNNGTLEYGYLSSGVLYWGTIANITNFSDTVSEI